MSSGPTFTNPEVPSSTSTSSSSRRILLIERSPEIRTRTRRALFAAGFEVEAAASGGEVRVAVGKESFHAVIVGISDLSHLSFLGQIRAIDPSVPIVAITKSRDEDFIHSARNAGADFIHGEPADLEGLEKVVSRAVNGGRAEHEVSKAPRQKTLLVFKNAAMKALSETAKRIAPTDSTVLLQGESGTGKEVFANFIHDHSRRAGQPFIAVNCGAIPENLLESQLLGHEKGSFTGAVSRQSGLFEIADHGTIFLDEVAEISLDMQVKLLRVLQTREFRRLGGNRVIKVNVRVIAASNRDLNEDVGAGRFRADLFYRLNVINLQIPPLRERCEDVKGLVDHFIEKLEKERSIKAKEFSPEAVALLEANPWPGNVRELENAVERLLLLSAGERIEPEDVRGQLSEAPIPHEHSTSTFSPDLSLADVERMHIAGVLTRNGWNKMKSARVLGINVKTLYNKIRAYNIRQEAAGGAS